MHRHLKERRGCYSTSTRQPRHGTALRSTQPPRGGAPKLSASPETRAAAGSGSGDKQAKAKLCRLETDEVAVAFGPPTGCEVITEAAHRPLLGVRPDPRPHRYP